MSGFAREPRLGLERERPRRLLAQIDACEPFRGLPAVTTALDIASCSAGEALRFQRRAAGIIQAHSLDDFQEAVGIVRRLHDALERVAARAVEQKSFLLVRAWHAREPFGIGEVSGEVLHLPELDLDPGFLTCGDGRTLHSVELIAGGARLQCVLSIFESLSGEGKATL